jgi:hypothetical protein
MRQNVAARKLHLVPLLAIGALVFTIFGFLSILVESAGPNDVELSKVYGAGVSGTICVEQGACSNPDSCGEPQLRMHTQPLGFHYVCVGQEGCTGGISAVCALRWWTSNTCTQNPAAPCCSKKSCIHVPPPTGPSNPGTCVGDASQAASGVRNTCS